LKFKQLESTIDGAKVRVRSPNVQKTEKMAAEIKKSVEFSGKQALSGI